jgi:thiamine biosynthesis lipoprotein
MRHGTFAAMGTTVEAWTETAMDFELTVRWFEEVESVCSRFIPASELSAVNRDPRDRVHVTALLAEVLQRAHDMRRVTDGLVDAGLGAPLVAWGYDRTFEEVMALGEAPGPNETEVRWAIASGVLERSPGTLMDLGGIGKGWACDSAVEQGPALVVSAGGDVRSDHPDTRIPVMDPWGATVATVDLGRGALATSSTAQRRWRVGDGDAHHVIDPRTMRPADTPILSATVVCSTAVEAEAGAKAVLILGEHGLAWADRQEWIASALVVWHDGSVFATRGMEMVA